MKYFFRICIPLGITLLTLLSACKDNDDTPTGSSELSWVAVSLPNGIYQNPNTLYTLNFSANGTLYVASYSHLYVSSDTGATWTDHPQFPNNNINTAAADSTAGVLSISPNGVLYSEIYGISPSDNSKGPISFLYRSLDGGVSWQQVQLPASDTKFNPPVFNSSGAAFISSSSAIYESQNNGTTWSTILTTGQSQKIIAVAVAQNGTVFGEITELGILRSTNGGTTWDTVNTGLPSFTDSTNPEPYIVGISPAGAIYLEIYTQGVPGASLANTIYYSNDNGTTWNEAGNGIANNANVSKMLFLNNGGMIALSAFGNYNSADGIHWTAYNIDLPGNNTGLQGLDASQFLYSEVYNGGLFRTAKPID